MNLQISNSYNGTYGSAAVLDSFLGRLVPVSTNRISGGFQKVTGFTGGDTRSGMMASIFGTGEQSDYYHTSLFLRTNGDSTDIYLSDIGFEDSDENTPISSAIRVGLVVHQAGRNQAADGEYIFATAARRIRKQNIILPQARRVMCWTAHGPMEPQSLLPHMTRTHIAIIIKTPEL